MDLLRSGREFYNLELETTNLLGVVDPDAGPYEASFDGDTSWHTGTQDGPSGFWQWLVAGPNAPAPGVGVTVVAVINETIYPLIRLVDNPEVIVDEAPPIKLLQPQ